MKGIYPKIPSHYSSDLSAMIKAMLQVDSENRPNTKQILHMPVFIAKYNEKFKTDENEQG
jgi:NIMA (never in mitosis gene a)-related kinase